MPKFKPGDRARIVCQPYLKNPAKLVGHTVTITALDTPPARVIRVTEDSTGYVFDCDCGNYHGALTDSCLEPITKPKPALGSWEKLKKILKTDIRETSGLPLSIRNRHTGANQP